METNKILSCQICGQKKGIAEAIPADSIRGPILEMIKAKYPNWDETGCICRADLNRLRAEYVESILEQERGEVETLGSSTSKNIEETELITRNVNDEFDKSITFGEKMADRIAEFGGSWQFLGIFALILFAWVLMNTVVIFLKPFDPYPFIFLNLILSCLAAIQAPVIMMSQNRQEDKDRFRSENDFKTNLKAELEIRSLHDKLDYLLMHQWQRLLEIQKIQMELMDQLESKNPEPLEEKNEPGEKNS
jgi:uncharacterized membrane protein